MVEAQEEQIKYFMTYQNKSVWMSSLFIKIKSRRVPAMSEKRCIDEVTEEDMLRKLFGHEEVEREGEAEGVAGGVVVLGKGNRSLPRSGEDEWKVGSRGLEETGRPWGSKGRRGWGSGSGSGMPERKEQVGNGVEGFC